MTEGRQALRQASASKAHSWRGNGTGRECELNHCCSLSPELQWSLLREWRELVGSCFKFQILLHSHCARHLPEAGLRATWGTDTDHSSGPGSASSGWPSHPHYHYYRLSFVCQNFSQLIAKKHQREKARNVLVNVNPQQN